MGDCLILKAALPQVYGNEAVCCNDVGVECTPDGLHVSGIKLTGLNIGGHLPSQFSQLTALTTLNLTHNLFTGQVPDSWQNLPNLAILDLSYNLLNGSAPSWLPHIPGANASFNCFVASPDAASQLNPSCNASSSPSIASASLPAFTVPTQSDKLNDRGIAIVASLTGAAALFGIILACIVCRRRALYANWKGDVRARNADALEATRDAFKEASVVVAVPAREPRIAAGSASPPLMPQRFAMSTGEVRPGYPRAGVSAGAAWLPEREGSFDSVRVRDEDRKRDEWMRQRMVR